MRHTIELDDDLERRLKELAARSGNSEDELLHQSIAQLLEHLEGAENAPPVRSTPHVMGGDACVRNTRIPIWLLVQYKRQGMTDGKLLMSYPGLNAADLSAAWDYFAAHGPEIEAQMRRHDEGG